MSTERVSAPGVDRAALHHTLQRLARAGDAPWLNLEVARRMAERLPLIREAPTNWIDWWGHLGGGAGHVHAVWPRAERHVVEPTPTLVELSRQAMRGPWWSFGGRSAAQQRVHLETQAFPGKVRMVWANMMLHASPDMEATLARWHEVLEVGGFLMFSTLGPDTLRELRQVYAELGWPAPHPPFTDMHDIGDRLVASGFGDPVMDQEHLTLSWTSPAALLAELRTMGGHLGAAREAGLRTPRWRERLYHALAARADAQGRIRLGFEIVYGHAFKPEPRVASGEPTTVSVDALRLTMRNRRRLGDGR